MAPRAPLAKHGDLTPSPIDKNADHEAAASLVNSAYTNERLSIVRSVQVVPLFTKRAWDRLIASGTLIWRDFNPIICLWLNFQAIATPGKRSDLSRHYMSFPNKLLTFNLLFLDDLKAELHEARTMSDGPPLRSTASWRSRRSKLSERNGYRVAAATRSWPGWYKRVVAGTHGARRADRGLQSSR